MSVQVQSVVVTKPIHALWEGERESKHFVLPARPWLSLYNNFLSRHRQKQEENDSEHEVHLAPIQHLPDELVLHVFERLAPYYLGRLACVCKHWTQLVEHPRLWEHACQDAFLTTMPDKAQQRKLAGMMYRWSWKRLFLEHPHLRFDGLYVSRNQYVKTGVVEFANFRPVHVVVYYRYYRFFPDGTLLYQTSPSVVSKVYKGLLGPKGRFFKEDSMTPSQHATHAHIFVGRYKITSTKIWNVIRYSNNTSTEIRCKMNLRSTVQGANNRLDIEQLYTYDKDLHRVQPLDPNQQQAHQQGVGPDGFPATPDAEPPDGVIRREHKRGLSTCVFVPWEQVHSSVLNLPPDKMDTWIPG